MQDIDEADFCKFLSGSKYDLRHDLEVWSFISFFLELFPVPLSGMYITALLFFSGMTFCPWT